MKQRTLVKRLWTVAATVGIVIAMALPAMASTLPNGLTVGGQTLAGSTVEEAKEIADNYSKTLSEQKITLDIETENIETTPGELGCYWSNKDDVDSTIASYGTGNLIKRYMMSSDLNRTPVDIKLEISADEDKINSFIDKKCASAVATPTDATIVREDGKFVVTPSISGVSVDKAATVKAINDALGEGLTAPVTVKAVAAVSEPAVTTEDLESIQDLLGTFTTDFSSSGTARSTNLRVGAGKINGHILMPGETLSGYECMHPFTKANGYQTSKAYENGMVVDSVGGGVCQIATTLYNASLRAEVEITQRQNHSMIVTYVDPSADAAIAGTYKDIKITNNYSTPIYIEAYTEGKKLTFSIYGKETRAKNRKVEFVSETLGTWSAGDPTMQVDASLAPGAQVKVQSAHGGRKSRLWKVVTVDGVETERSIVSTDNYNASKAIYRVGPAAAPAPAEGQAAPAEGQTSPDAPAETSPSVTPIEGVNGGPGVS